MVATNKVSSIEGSNESIEKYGKLSKTRKLFKSWKLSKIGKLLKSRKSAKSGKKSSKSENLYNFDAKENRPSFLTPNAKIAFNHLWLAFIKALIFWHFDLECHI